MRGRHARESNSNIIILAVLLIAVIGVTAYFYLDKTTVSMEIAAIDSTKYADTVYEKGNQHEARGVPLSKVATEDLSDNVYKTPLGFSIVSYSNKWKGEKLVEIYNELLNNVHGEEITYVSEIDVFPGSSEIDSNIAGTQSSKQENFSVFFDLPSLVPNSFKYSVKPNVSVIELYNMDRFESATQAARTISHEYGHHFTVFYFLKDNEDPLDSEYYDLRDLGSAGHDVVFTDWNTYIENHEWEIHELAAEDYVQLMGSPNAKQTREYLDIYDLIKTGKDDYNPKINDRVYNLVPQENIYLPTADDVSGLRDYYYSFIGKTNEYSPLEPVDFNLKRTKRSSYGYVYYDITWTKTSVDKDALYTLVCCNTDGEPIWPVRTIHGNQTAVARVGKMSNNYVYWTDRITEEDRIFKLYLLLPDGRIQASKPFYVNF